MNDIDEHAQKLLGDGRPPIHTVAELNKLPNGSVIRATWCNYTFEKFSDGWFTPGRDSSIPYPLGVRDGIGEPTVLIWHPDWQPVTFQERP